MAVFLVLADSDRPDLNTHLLSKMAPDNIRRLAPGQWLVSLGTTAQGATEYLGLGEGQFGRVMVALVTSYFGWHDKNIWDWIALKGKL